MEESRQQGTCARCNTVTSVTMLAGSLVCDVCRDDIDNAIGRPHPETER